MNFSSDERMAINATLDRLTERWDYQDAKSIIGIFNKVPLSKYQLLVEILEDSKDSFTGFTVSKAM